MRLVDRGCFVLRRPAIILDRLLDARRRILQVFKAHCGMELQMGIEGQKPRLRDCRNLRAVVQVKEDEPGLRTIVFRKIGGLGFQVAENRFNRCGQAALADHSIARSTGIDTLSKQRIGPPPARDSSPR